MPLHRLPTYVNFKLTGSAVSSLQSIGDLCQLDNDTLDNVEKTQLVELARLKTDVLTASPPPVP